MDFAKQIEGLRVEDVMEDGEGVAWLHAKQQQCVLGDTPNENLSTMMSSAQKSRMSPIRMFKP